MKRSLLIIAIILIAISTAWAQDRYNATFNISTNLRQHTTHNVRVRSLQAPTHFWAPVSTRCIRYLS